MTLHELTRELRAESEAMRALLDEALVLDPPIDLADWKRWAKHVSVCLPQRYGGSEGQADRLEGLTLEVLP